MIKAIGLTEKSWILYKGLTKLGLMRLEDDVYIVIGSEYAGSYKTVEELEETLKDKVQFEKANDKESEKVEVEGYPSKHYEAYDIEVGDFPSYAKREGSKDRYAAGYYCILFANGYQGSFCPRVSTLEAYKWIGPFKTKLEMDHTLRVENSK